MALNENPALSADQRQKFHALFSRFEERGLLEIYDIWRQGYDQAVQKSTFRLADLLGKNVRFEARGGTVLTGKLTKINQKTVNILVETGGRKVNWRVAPSYVKGEALFGTRDDRRRP